LNAFAQVRLELLIYIDFEKKCVKTNKYIISSKNVQNGLLFGDIRFVPIFEGVLQTVMKISVTPTLPESVGLSCWYFSEILKIANYNMGHSRLEGKERAVPLVTAETDKFRASYTGFFFVKRYISGSNDNNN